MEGKKRWWLGRRAIIGVAMVAVVGGGAGVAAASDRTWFAADAREAGSSGRQAVASEAPQRRAPEPVASGENTVPEPASPPKPSASRTSPKPPKPAADCSPAPQPVPPRARNGAVPSTRIPFNGQQVVSVCMTPVLGGAKAKVLTFNESAKLLEQLGTLRYAAKSMPCTKEYRGTFQVVVQTSNGTHVFNGEAHGCGYVTYKGVTFTGGRAIFTLIGQFVKS